MHTQESESERCIKPGLWSNHNFGWRPPWKNARSMWWQNEGLVTCDIFSLYLCFLSSFVFLALSYRILEQAKFWVSSWGKSINEKQVRLCWVVPALKNIKESPQHENWNGKLMLSLVSKRMCNIAHNIEINLAFGQEASGSKLIKHIIPGKDSILLNLLLCIFLRSFVLFVIHEFFTWAQQLAEYITLSCNHTHRKSRSL